MRELSFLDILLIFSQILDRLCLYFGEVKSVFALIFFIEKYVVKTIMVRISNWIKEKKIEPRIT